MLLLKNDDPLKNGQEKIKNRMPRIKLLPMILEEITIILEYKAYFRNNIGHKKLFEDPL